MLQLRHTTLLLLIAAALGLSGCYTRARVAFRAQVPSTVTVTTAPPPVRPAVAQRPPKPGDDAVWVSGYYQWSGTAWVWVDGHWERDRAGYVWVAPVANDVNGRVEYHPGYWRPAEAQPAPAYRGSGTVRVSVRSPEPPRSGATVTARSPSGGTVHRADGTPARAQVPERGATTATGSAPATRPHERGATTSSGSAPATRPHERGATTASGSQPTPRQPPQVQRPVEREDGREVDRGQTPARVLSCRVETPRAPEGGLVTVRGAFGAQARVQIGGQLAQVAARGQGEMQVRVPGSSGGGMVRVIDDGRTANCGNLSVTGR